MKINLWVRRPCQMLVAALFAGAALAADVPEPQKPAAVDTAQTQVRPDSHGQVYAIVNGRSIPRLDYENAFATLVRQKFYHGQIPDAELAAVREEIKIKLVQRIALLDEAARRGIAPDENQINETVAGYDSRYANSPQWRENRELLLPELRKQLAEQSQVAQLERIVKKIDEPAEADVVDFYNQNPSLFTEPDKLRLAVILLAVDPSSPATAWQATREEAKAIYGRLAGGADFAEAARMHSSAYAENSGDMGYLHRGMLPELLQDKIDKFELGKINEPIDTLEGVAIFQLVDRLVAKKREFADVAQRARELLIRERQDKAWRQLVDQLVAKADVKFMHSMSVEQRDGSRN